MSETVIHREGGFLVYFLCFVDKMWIYSGYNVE